MEEKKPDHLTQRQLRQALLRKFEQSGILNSLKTQLRTELLKEFNGKLQTNSDKNILHKQRDLPIVQKAMNSLIAEYFTVFDYSYTLNVFLPESGASSSEQLSREDILKVLSINGGSRDKLLSRISNDKENKSPSEWPSSSLLALFVQYVAEKTSISVSSSGCQTDAPPRNPQSLEHRLKTVDQQYLEKYLDERNTPIRSTEERMIKFQREVTENSKKEIEAEVLRIRNTEIAQVRLEERQKFYRELECAREEIEREYQYKEAMLRKREEEAEEKTKKKEALLETARYQARQNLLTEMERLQSREMEIKRAAQLDTRSPYI